MEYQQKSKLLVLNDLVFIYTVTILLTVLGKIEHGLFIPTVSRIKFCFGKSFFYGEYNVF